jgi:hypothetical protein
MGKKEEEGSRGKTCGVVRVGLGSLMGKQGENLNKIKKNGSGACGAMIV